MAKATLTTLTPVHIGNGQKLKRDFDFVAENGKLGFIDLEKVVQIIGIDQIGQLTNILERGESVVNFLKNGTGHQGLQMEDFCHRISYNKAAGSKATELKEHYYTSIKGVCIPGSAVKGAIKTAVWESLATKEKQERWFQRDYGVVKDGRLVKFFADAIDKKLFGPSANEKTTRFLRIGDIHFPGSTTSIYEIGIYNKGYNDWQFKTGQSFLAECLPAQSSNQFNLLQNDHWFNENKKRYPEKWAGLFTDFITNGTLAFCTLINNYTSRQLKYELDDLEKEGFDSNTIGEDMLNELKRIKLMVDSFLKEQAKSTIIRVGGNSGWNFTTGGWVKASALSDLDYAAMRKTIQRNTVYNMDIWPKTRKMTMGGLPLGFVKIDLQAP